MKTIFTILFAAALSLNALANTTNAPVQRTTNNWGVTSFSTNAPGARTTNNWGVTSWSSAAPFSFKTQYLTSNITAYWVTNGGTGGSSSSIYYGAYYFNNQRSTNGALVFTNGSYVLVYGDTNWNYSPLSPAYPRTNLLWDLGTAFPDSSANNPYFTKLGASDGQWFNSNITSNNLSAKPLVFTIATNVTYFGVSNFTTNAPVTR